MPETQQYTDTEVFCVELCCIMSNQGTVLSGRETLWRYRLQATLSARRTHTLGEMDGQNWRFARLIQNQSTQHVGTIKGLVWRLR